MIITNRDSEGIVYRLACEIHIKGNGVFCKASVIRDALNGSRYYDV